MDQCCPFRCLRYALTLGCPATTWPSVVATWWLAAWQQSAAICDDGMTPSGSSLLGGRCSASPRWPVTYLCRRPATMAFLRLALLGPPRRYVACGRRRACSRCPFERSVIEGVTARCQLSPCEFNWYWRTPSVLRHDVTLWRRVAKFVTLSQLLGISQLAAAPRVLL